jgi:hypothetical protein
LDRVKHFFWVLCTQTFPFAQIVLVFVLLTLCLEFKPDEKPTTG